MKIITALDNFEIAEQLAKEEKIELICMDISYKEGIIEQLEQSKKVDMLILDEKIDGELSINDLIRQIKERARTIEIIIITQNKEETKKQIGRFKKIQIYETRKIKVKQIIEMIYSVEQPKSATSSPHQKSNNTLPKVKEQTQKSKQKPLKEQSQHKEEKIEQNQRPSQFQNIITISGAPGVGKTTIAILVAKYLAKKSQHISKILLVDLNLPEIQDIPTIFQISHPNTLVEIDSHINTIATKKYLKIKMLIKENDFQNIVVDVGNSIEEAEKQKILNIGKTNIVLVEPSIIGIKHANSLINYYIKELGINPKTIKIVINKQDRASIDISIIKKIISEKIISKLKYASEYNALVNNGFKNIRFILDKKEKQKIKKIAN